MSLSEREKLEYEIEILKSAIRVILGKPIGWRYENAESQLYELQVVLNDIANACEAIYTSDDSVSVTVAWIEDKAKRALGTKV